MPALIVTLIIAGSFFSGAFVLFFQHKSKRGSVSIILGFISLYVFYYGIYNGWMAIPEQK